MTKYTNKSAWSSPEVLANKKSDFVLEVKESDDVFSYGTLMWELYSQAIPFEGCSVSKITHMLVD
jgi:hypothetical protein